MTATIRDGDGISFVSYYNICREISSHHHNAYTGIALSGLIYNISFNFACIVVTVMTHDTIHTSYTVCPRTHQLIHWHRDIPGCQCHRQNTPLLQIASLPGSTFLFPIFLFRLHLFIIIIGDSRHVSLSFSSSG